jgi:hypothetical protein
MSVEEQYNNLPHRGEENNPASEDKARGLSHKSADDILMDYEKIAEAEGKPATSRDSGPHIGLNGGQSKDDNRGIDISKYAGPESKTSNAIDDPEAPYGTGPGNGLKDAPYGTDGSQN